MSKVNPPSEPDSNGENSDGELSADSPQADGAKDTTDVSRRVLFGQRRSTFSSPEQLDGFRKFLQSDLKRPR